MSRVSTLVVESAGAALAVRDLVGAAPPVMFVHGLGDSQRSWMGVIKHVRGTFRLVTYDLRGHGRSSVGAAYDIDVLVADLGTVIKTLQVDRPLLVGHSLGGLIAVEYAASHSCRGVIGIEGGLTVNRPPIAWADVAASMARPTNRLLSRALAALGLGSRLSVDEMRALAEGGERRERQLEGAYQHLRCRMMVVLGNKADPIPDGQTVRVAIRNAAQHLQRAHPDVEIAWLECGHMVPLQRPRELADLIMRFAAETSE
jgi:pimeloyl-ACP methyl ester carboxylesterase